MPDQNLSPQRQIAAAAVPRDITMPTHASDDDEDDDNDEDTTDGQDTTDTCPYCHKAIYDDDEQCPHCGQYISQEDRPASQKPWWLLAGVIVCLYIIYRWTFG